MSRAILYLAWGRQAFQKAVLEPGDKLMVGASEQVGFRILHDKQLGTSEAEVSFDGTSCHVRALNAETALLVNGQAASEGPLAHSEWFRIGDSTFMFCLERHTPPLACADPDKAAFFSQVQKTLRSAERNLYAVLDAARDDRILTLLRESPDETQSLLAGVKGDAMADVAPYLVKLDPQGWLLEALVTEGWGQSWGIYLDCSLSFKEMRKHFRHFLRVQEEGADGFLYFRFYDPRVLRIFVPTCTVGQLEQVFGEIREVWVEDQDGECVASAELRF